ncbi:histidine phosphatase family protein [Bacillaceae bacterium W0354]
MELLIIRHGESEADLLGVHEGRADFPLTKKGLEQARRMGEFVARNYPLELILASPLKRANQTATILQENTACPLIVDPELMEYNNGVLAGLNREEAAIKYPLPKEGRPIHIPIEDGESELEFRYRAEKAYYRMTHEYKDRKRIAIVSHGGFISNFIRAFLQLPMNTNTIFPTGDTGIHLLEVRERDHIVKFMNNQSHLE